MVERQGGCSRLFGRCPQGAAKLHRGLIYKPNVIRLRAHWNTGAIADVEILRLTLQYAVVPHSLRDEMPSPSKTTPAAIIRAARQLLERRGRDEFSMHDVATAIGVRTPSLYGHFANRAALISSVELMLWDELRRRTLAAAATSLDPVRTLRAQARAYRAFATANPHGYALLYDADAPRSEVATGARSAALSPAMPAFTALAGERNALGAARVLTPFLHGFVSMEPERSGSVPVWMQRSKTAS
jgi:AcrR family transcriptional regulator